MSWNKEVPANWHYAENADSEHIGRNLLEEEDALPDPMSLWVMQRAKNLNKACYNLNRKIQ